MKALRIATRGSVLALVQTKHVIRMLKEKHPDLKIEINPVATAGDQNTDEPLWKLEGVGFFTTQIEKTLLEKRADIAVHSFKDLPTAQTPGLTVTAVPMRENPADVLVCNQKISSLADIPAGAVIGTSSLRRQAQLLRLRPDLITAPLRGNVNTRLRKLDEKQYDILIMAAAGLIRLGLQEQISLWLNPVEFLPAPAQGALAVQTRADDKNTIELVGTINDAQTRRIVSAERQVLRRLHPGCHAPVGAFAQKQGEAIHISAFASKPDGSEFLRKEIQGPFQQAEKWADEIAEQMIAAGAKRILEGT
ncbi:MAG: hydroxymethylbilane synthase [Planctomycetes bacterium]|nr:hydroxymethylbilane synthase [Planctomycetota bacterium]